MVDDVLRMRATIVPDEALASIRKIQGGLVDLSQKGGTGFKAVNKEAETFAKTIKTIGVETATKLVPGLMAIGSTAGPIGLAAAALTAAGIAVVAFSSALVRANLQARQMGISINALKAMQTFAEKAGVSVGSLTSTLADFGSQAAQMKWQVGSLFDTLTQLGKYDLREKIIAASGDPVKQLRLQLEDINKVFSDPKRGPGVAREYAKRVGVDPSLIGLDPNKLEEAAKNAPNVYSKVLPEAQKVHEKFVQIREEAGLTTIEIGNWAIELGKVLNKTPGELLPAPHQVFPGGTRPAPLEHRQHGGSVMGGRPYLVGEAGAEVMVPGSSGTIANFGGAGYKNLSGSNSVDASRVIQKGVFDALVQFFSYLQMLTKAGDAAAAGGVLNASFGGSSGAASARAGGVVGGKGSVGNASVDSDAAGTPKMTQSKREVAKIAADTLRKGGMSENAIAGVLANVQDESGFDPNLRHPDQPRFSGEAHFAHGLYQEGGTEWNNYAAWIAKEHPGGNWKDPALQSEFLAQNLQKNYPGLWKQMQEAKTPGEAASLFVRKYLKPRADLAAGRSAKYLRGVPGVKKYTGDDAPNGQAKGANVGEDGKASGARSITPQDPAAEGYRSGGYSGDMTAEQLRAFGQRRLNEGIPKATEDDEKMYEEEKQRRIRLDRGKQSMIDQSISGGAPQGHVAVTIHSDGTKAAVAAKSSGMFQSPRITQHRQMLRTIDAGAKGLA
jgi:hypothetical protein